MYQFKDKITKVTLKPRPNNIKTQQKLKKGLTLISNNNFSGKRIV